MAAEKKIYPPTVQDNLGLVHSCAHRLSGKGIEYEELFSAGSVGLVKAAASFDPERGVLFSTYAVPVILGEIKRLFRDGGTIKVSRSMKELSLKIRGIQEKYRRENDTEPTTHQIAEILGVKPEEVAEAICACSHPISLTAGEDGEDGGQLDIAVESHEDQTVSMLALKESIQTLSNEDQRLIVMRYYKNKTQTEVAKVLGLTQVQVSRREKKILLMLRNQLE